MQYDERGYGSKTYRFGPYASRSTSVGPIDLFSYNQRGHHVNRTAALAPHQSDATSMRRRMAIQDILNPSDEEVRPYSQSQPSDSDEDGGSMSRPSRTIDISPRTYMASRSRSRSDRAGTASSRSRGRSRSPSSSPSTGRKRSTESASSDVPPRSRPFRPPYTDEQMLFIWYLRIDCLYSWTDLAEEYNARFSRGGIDERPLTGLQCKYYRILKLWGVPDVRDMARDQDMVRMYGMRKWTDGKVQHFPWLDEGYLKDGATRYSQRADEREYTHHLIESLN